MGKIQKIDMIESKGPKWSRVILSRLAVRYPNVIGKKAGAQEGIASPELERALSPKLDRNWYWHENHGSAMIRWPQQILGHRGDYGRKQTHRFCFAF